MNAAPLMCPASKSEGRLSTCMTTTVGSFSSAARSAGDTSKPVAGARAADNAKASAAVDIRQELVPLLVGCQQERPKSLGRTVMSRAMPTGAQEIRRKIFLLIFW